MPFGHTQVIRITIRPFTLKNINIFYFELSGQIAIRLFSIKKTRKFSTVKWQFGHTQVILPFTLKLKRKRNLRHSNHTSYRVFNSKLILDLGYSSVFTSYQLQKVMFFDTDFLLQRLIVSSGSSGRVRGGARNMKSMRPPSAAIFFMTYFHRARGGAMAPSVPLDPLLILN